MIVLMPIRDQVYTQVMEAVRSVFPSCTFIVSCGNPEVISVPQADVIISHVNGSSGSIYENMRNYYDNIIKGFFPVIASHSDDEPLLFLHDNIIINETAINCVTGLDEFIFISSPIRVWPGTPYWDDSDRCVGFLKGNFVMTHSYEYTELEFRGRTTIQLIKNHLAPEQYKHDPEVVVQELDSNWV